MSAKRPTQMLRLTSPEPVSGPSYRQVATVPVEYMDGIFCVGEDAVHRKQSVPIGESASSPFFRVPPATL